MSANTKLSEGRRQVLAEMLVSIANRTFTEPEHSQFWVTLLSVESGFDQAAKSPVGAIGISQLMPEYRNDFARLCGFGEVEVKDLQDAYTNTRLSACVFRQLIEDTGSVPLALTAYNSGANSASTKAAKKGEAPTADETRGYISKVWLRLTNTRKELASD